MHTDVIDIGVGDDILVVDDTPADLVAIEAALAPLGRTLVFAASGVAALAKLLAQDFAVIVLDVAMPEMTGIETARLIGARERNRGTPILFVSAVDQRNGAMDDAIDEAYAAGGCDFLTKPLRPELLRAKVSVFLKLQERTRELHRKAEQLRDSQVRLYEHELAEQRKRFESELLDTKLDRLGEADRRQHELAALIGNELINPLHTLRVAFDLLRDHPNADRSGRIYPMIEHRLDHVTRLVEGLIDVAQLAAGQLRIVPETVNVGELVRTALDACRTVLDERRLTVQLWAETGSPPVVLGDPVRLHQAASAVLDHAARSAREDSTIDIDCEIDAGDVVIRIGYAGRGFGPAVLRRVFDMCAVDCDDDAQAGRLRLGFALARRLIELHDGSIQAASGGIAQGATFEIRLPQPPQDVDLVSLDYCDPLAMPTARMAAPERPPDVAEELG